MQPILNTDNQDHFTYTCYHFTIDIYGGIVVDRVESLQVTLKITKEDKRPIRDTLNLYKESTVKGLCKRIAERLGYELGKVQDQIEQLTQALEEYRYKVITTVEAQAQDSYELTTKERKSAKSFLQRSNLISRTNDLLSEIVVGEEENRLIIFLIYMYVKMKRPLHIISFGSSGTGKTHLQSTLAQCIARHHRVEVTSMSSHSLYYENDLKHKILLIEDLDGLNEDAHYAVRELQSKGRANRRLPKVDKRGHTSVMDIEAIGPVCVAGCTTKERLYEDNANRSFLLHLDESPEQDKRIMQYQSKRFAGDIDEAQIASIYTRCQHLFEVLEPIDIINPYARHLLIPDTVFKQRRTNAHYLQFIECVTYFHQYQREKHKREDGTVYIETTLEDIEIANTLMESVLVRKSDDLSGACRNYLEQVRTFLKQQEKEEYRNAEIRERLFIPYSTQKRHTTQLLEQGYIRIKYGTQATGYVYVLEEKETLSTLHGFVNDWLTHHTNKARSQA